MTSLKIFVKRGALWRFNRLTRDAHALPVKVEWDRRHTDRRATPTAVSDEQRKQDRRGAAPFTWDTAEFVVVNDPQSPRS
jgi:hypothetical protein